MQISSKNNNYSTSQFTRNTVNNTDKNFVKNNYFANDVSNQTTTDVSNTRKSTTFVNSTYMQSKILNTDKSSEDTTQTIKQISNSTKINRNVDREYLISKLDDKNNMVQNLRVTDIYGNLLGVGSVAYAENYDPENPVFIVRGEDDKGYYEAYVELNKIDPTKCTNIEYEALTWYHSIERAARGIKGDFDIMPFNRGVDTDVLESSTATYNLGEAYKSALSLGLYDYNSITKEIAIFDKLWGKNFQYLWH